MTHCLQASENQISQLLNLHVQIINLHDVLQCHVIVTVIDMIIKTKQMLSFGRGGEAQAVKAQYSSGKGAFKDTCTKTALFYLCLKMLIFIIEQ